MVADPAGSEACDLLKERCWERGLALDDEGREGIGEGSQGRAHIVSLVVVWNTSLIFKGLFKQRSSLRVLFQTCFWCDVTANTQ